jgi:RNA polymerase sigma factor (sigma-70 family)
MTLYTQEELDVSPADHDMHLLRQYALEGSEWAFSEIVERHGKWIYGICRRALHDRELAEDATQAVFLTLSRKAAGMPEQTRLSGWLYRATKFAVADARKRERRYRRREEVARRLATERAERLDPAPVPQPDAYEISLDSALGSLNERDRGVLLMHFYEGLTVRQMGDLLGLSREGAKKRVSRALARLRIKMGAKSTTAAAMGSLVAAGMEAAVAEAMPAALVRTIVSAATGSAASASVRGLGIAGAVLRAMMGPAGAASNLLRGTAAIKLAGATAMVAAGVLYYGPLNRPSRATTSDIKATPAAVRLVPGGSNNTLASVTGNLAAVRLSNDGGLIGGAAARNLSTAGAQVQPPGTVTVAGAAFRATRPVDAELLRHDERPAAADPVVRGSIARGSSSSDADFMLAAARASASSGGGDSDDAVSQTVEPAAMPAAVRDAAKPVESSTEATPIDQSRAAATAAAAAAMTASGQTSTSLPALAGQSGTQSNSSISSTACASDSSGTSMPAPPTGAAPSSGTGAPGCGIVTAVNIGGSPSATGNTVAILPPTTGGSPPPVGQAGGWSSNPPSDQRTDHSGAHGFSFGGGGFAWFGQAGGNPPVSQAWVFADLPAAGGAQYLDGPPAGVFAAVAAASAGLPSVSGNGVGFATPDVIRLGAIDLDGADASALAATGIGSTSAPCGTSSGGMSGASAGAGESSDALTTAALASDPINWSTVCPPMGSGSGDWSSVSLATSAAPNVHWRVNAILAAWDPGLSVEHFAFELEGDPGSVDPALAVAPEPSSLAIAAASVGLLARRRRKNI